MILQFVEGKLENYRERGKIHWAKLLCFSWFSRIPRKLFHEYKLLSLIILNNKYCWPRQCKVFLQKLRWGWNREHLAQRIFPHQCMFHGGHSFQVVCILHCTNHTSIQTLVLSIHSLKIIIQATKIVEVETKPNQGVNNILMLWIVHIMLQMDDKVCPFLSNITVYYV